MWFDFIYNVTWLINKNRFLNILSNMPIAGIVPNFFIFFIEVCQCDYNLSEINLNACIHCATANKQTHRTSGNYFTLRM